VAFSPGDFLRRKGAVPATILTLGLVAGLAVVGTWTSVEISSKPQFCGSCHVMSPYYESWKESSHRNVACVECHIAPGVTAEFRKKFEALSMVASYFTGTYGTNPWAEIDDAACLRCHERRLLAGKELFGDVLFDHSSHLSGMRRGKKLRCTSCHSQIVQGSHIAVTTSTCILCHFKGKESNTDTARCTLCHHIPSKVIQHETLTLNHADVGRFGMECTSCHARPEGSDGRVPRERCVTCHNKASALDKYDDTELMHQTHVTDHKVDCMNCHLELEHVGPPQIEKASSACSTCHLKGHGPQMNLYAGIGGRGVANIPDPMFLAGVRCEGCHLEIPGREVETRAASDLSCMSCHGPEYRKIYLSWKEGLARRTDSLRAQLEKTASAVGRSGSASGDSEPTALDDARFNLEMVARGKGIHNVRYAYALLDRSHEDMNRARTERGLAELPLPWTEVGQGSPCMQCHQGIENQSGRFEGKRYAHGPHVVRAGLDCETCHQPHEDRPAGEVVAFGVEGCLSCHHDGGIERGCTSCHGDVTSRVVRSFRGEFAHGLHVTDLEMECSTCHEVTAAGDVNLQKEACGECHE
jgi:nitrate/TMAO reductase-like tetraheme cytochrome c subunit